MPQVLPLGRENPQSGGRWFVCVCVGGGGGGGVGMNALATQSPFALRPQADLDLGGAERVQSGRGESERERKLRTLLVSTAINSF